NLDQLFHPANATDQRTVPFFEEHTRAKRESARLAANLVVVRFPPGNQRSSLFFNTDNGSKGQDHIQHLLHTALIEGENRQAPTDKLRRDVRLKVGEC